MWLLIYSLICAGLAQVLLLLMFKMSVSETKRVIKRGKRRITDPSHSDEKSSMWGPLKQAAQDDSLDHVKDGKNGSKDKNISVIVGTSDNGVAINSPDQPKVAGYAFREEIERVGFEKRRDFPSSKSAQTDEGVESVIAGDANEDVFANGLREEKNVEDECQTRVSEDNDSNTGIATLVANMTTTLESLTRGVANVSTPKLSEQQAEIKTGPSRSPDSRLLEPERRKVFPLLSDQSNYEDVIESDEEPVRLPPNVEGNATRGSNLNNLSMSVSRTNSNTRVKVTPCNVSSSPTVTESSLNRTSQTASDDPDLDQQSVGEVGKIARVSVSEPADVPAGCKTMASTMEIGLIRDIIFNLAVFHEHLSQSENPMSRFYTFWLTSTISCYKMTKAFLEASGKVYRTVAPKFIQNSGVRIQRNIWRKLTDLDDGLSSSLAHQLSKKPFLKNSLIGTVTDTKLYQKVFKKN